MVRACVILKAGKLLLGAVSIGLCLSTQSLAQIHASMSVFNHAIALPGPAILSSAHLGADMGLTFYYKERSKHERFLHTQLGVYYQRLIHTGVQLYGEYHYRYRLARQLGIDGAVGLGGLSTVMATELFHLNEWGQYEATGRARMHVQASAAIGLTYGQRTQRFQPFVQYRFRVFTPFAKAYVPFVPCTSLHIGAFYRLNQ